MQARTEPGQFCLQLIYDTFVFLVWEPINPSLITSSSLRELSDKSQKVNLFHALQGCESERKFLARKT